MGARFADPSSLRVLISTTGVPKYKILGVTTRCMFNDGVRGSSEAGVVTASSTITPREPLRVRILAPELNGNLVRNLPVYV
jgi:hypothetical protein